MSIQVSATEVHRISLDLEQEALFPLTSWGTKAHTLTAKPSAMPKYKLATITFLRRCTGRARGYLTSYYETRISSTKTSHFNFWKINTKQHEIIWWKEITPKDSTLFLPFYTVLTLLLWRYLTARKIWKRYLLSLLLSNPWQ